jgi:hypothetical protein
MAHFASCARDPRLPCWLKTGMYLVRMHQPTYMISPLSSQPSGVDRPRNGHAKGKKVFVWHHLQAPCAYVGVSQSNQPMCECFLHSSVMLSCSSVCFNSRALAMTKPLVAIDKVQFADNKEFERNKIFIYRFCHSVVRTTAVLSGGERIGRTGYNSRSCTPHRLRHILRFRQVIS